MNDIGVNNNTVLIAGNDGTIMQSDNTSSYLEWEFYNCNSTIDFNVVALSSATDYSASGDLNSSNDNVYLSQSSTEYSYGTNSIISSEYDGTDYYYLNSAGEIYKNGTIESYNPSNSVMNNPGNLSVDFAVAESGKIFKNNLTEWEMLTSMSAPDMNAATTIPGTNTCFAAGNSGVLESNDGGQSWTTSTTSSNALYCISFSDANNGFAGGENGSIIKYSNSIWTSCTSNTIYNINDIHAFSSNLAVAVGENGVHKSTNGVDFSSITVPTGADNLNALYFLNSNTGYAVGDDGMVIKTTDGGDNWILSNDNNNVISSSSILTDVHFTSFDIGYITGTSGDMFKTSDGGHTWTTVDLGGNTNDLNGITFNGNNGYISGTGSTELLLDDEDGLYSTRYWYDKLGRLVASQNTKQYNKIPPTYSYTKFDAMGRIIEAGELESSIQPSESLLNSPAYPDNWNTVRSEVVKTQYDYTYNSTINSLFGSSGQENLRNRVASSMIYDTYDTNSTNTYDYGMHYSYDIHGNVKTLIYDLTSLSSINNQYKRLDYEYDLVSGNVEKVTYQDGEPDLMIHKYEYDADNRITKVWTSKDGVNWDRDAKYYYYAHGPLARAELGHNKVQGIDNAYTIQGWLKGVNSETLINRRDIGKDGLDTTGTNLHRYVASDEYGYSLGYFAGDYSEINTPTNEWLADKSGTELQDSTYGLYNGNISRMVTSIREFVQGNSNEIFANVYRYDQLNRLTKTRNYTSNDVISSNNWNSASMNYDYGVNIGYDKNGNILTLDRNADVNSNSNFDAMDKLEYVYEDTLNGYPRNTNKLLSVDEQRDNSGNSMAGYDDIKPGQISGDNYAYDDIGNLIEDEQQEIEEIEWTITGKVKSVSRTSSSTKPDLEFEYDPLGNRIHKKVINKNSQYLLANVVDYYYIRDAQGNIMSIYKTMNNEIGNTIESTFSQADNPIYGSDRIGVQERNQWLVKQEYSTQSGNPVLVSTDYFAGNGNVKDQYRGDKDYELKNHLGNVLAIVSDKRTPVFNTVTQNFENFDAIVFGAQEYYPFGSILPSRSYNSTEYRFGFGGHEKDDEVNGVTGSHYTTQARLYDSRLGRWWSIDPKFKLQPGWSPYKGFLDNPILYQDPAGETEYITIITENQKTGETKIEQKTANRIMTDGVKHAKDGMGDCWSYENYYYDYNTVVYNTVDADGNVSSTSTSSIRYDKVKDKDYVWAGGNKSGDTKLESWTDWIPEITDIGGLIIYGSASSSEDSPGTPTTGKVWGSFDFGAFSEMMGLITTAAKTRGENTLGPNFSGKKATELADNAKSVVEYNQKKSSPTTSGGDFTCPTCGGHYSASDTAKHNKELRRKSAPSPGYQPVEEEN